MLILETVSQPVENLNLNCIYGIFFSLLHAFLRARTLTKNTLIDSSRNCFVVVACFRHNNLLFKKVLDADYSLFTVALTNTHKTCKEYLF